MSTYIHKTDRRLRIRSDFIRKNPIKVEDLIQELSQISAIESIKHRHHAGSVAIVFDQSELKADDLLEVLESHHWTMAQDQPMFIENAVKTGAKSLTRGLTAVALTRLVGPSISRMLFH